MKNKQMKLAALTVAITAGVMAHPFPAHAEETQEPQAAQEHTAEAVTDTQSNEKNSESNTSIKENHALSDVQSDNSSSENTGIENTAIDAEKDNIISDSTQPTSDSIVSDSEEKNTHNLVSTENKSNDNSDATIPSTIKNTADSAENITETTSDFDTTETTRL